MAKVVIDTGSYSIRAGFASDKKPSFEYPSNRLQFLVEFKTKRLSGQEIEGDTKQMEKFLKQSAPVWEDAFKTKVATEPDKQPVLLTDASHIPKLQREKTATIFFENFHAPSLLIAGQSALAIYGAGLDHGCVLNVGANFTECVPIFEPDNRIYGVDARRTAVGGNDVTEYLAKLLEQKGSPLDPKDEHTVSKLTFIKEKSGRVALDYNKAKGSAPAQDISLPDGSVVKIGAEALTLTEFLFEPKLGESGEVGVYDTLHYTLQNARSNARLKDVVIAGGSSLFSGFKERIAKELKDAKPLKIFANKLVDVEDSGLLPWIGGAIVANLSTFQGSFVTKKEYDEHGPAVVHKKWLM